MVAHRSLRSPQRGLSRCLEGGKNYALAPSVPIPLPSKGTGCYSCGMANEVSVLRGSRLTKAGFLHAFSTRAGGVSEAPYASLNLGRAVGDSLENVLENHKRLAVAVGYEPAHLFERSQVHGSDVYEVHSGDRTEVVREGKSDALVARSKGTAVGVRVADCVPVLVGDTVSKNVAAIHAGWRGVVNGVVREALKVLGGDPANYVAAIGPSIGPCCFEVGDEVASQLAEAVGDGIVLRRGPTKPHVDLWRAVEQQLHHAGVKTIDTLGECTQCSREQFFSYRGEGPQSGRMLAVIVAG